MSERLFEWEDFWGLIGTSVALFGIITVLMIFSKLIFADNKIVYCMISSHSTILQNPAGNTPAYITTNEFKLEGQIDWRSNQTIGYFPTYDQTLAAAKAYGCPLNNAGR